MLGIKKENLGRIMAVNNSVLTKWANVIAFVLTVITNGLAGSTTIIGGKETAQISDANPTLITPAGYVFSIWGIIYLLLGVFMVYQALPRNSEKDFHNKIGWFFVLSCVANIVWLFVWQFGYLSLSVIFMFLILASLILIYLRLGVGKSDVSLGEKLAVHLPFSVYLGWITIASIANVAATLVSLDWGGFGTDPVTWAILIVIVALLITIFVLATRRDIAYALVIVWALVGISVKQTGNPTIVMVTQVSAVIVAVSLIAAILLIMLRRR